ncbi:rho guanine nucleotide exchange factor 10-like protein isoform X2 [Cynoglossus semilaevis]|nr:rho guanine nucleotide exchange factor 10-like protein isoform X2 [Cynoglossus semilaevis]XP_024914863.1 rho guanine nucleotide exchange factor 10-like protein isoform X2 [Cynoglossus semilaevis]
MKAARISTRDGLEKTKLAMIRSVSSLQRKDSGEGKDDSGYIDVSLCEIKHPPAKLCPMPEGLSSQQVLRRLILSSIIQSERNYLDSLKRILQEYQKPLLESKNCILNTKKVQQIFYRVQEIHQCHSMFQIALASRMAEWDHCEKIGDLFVASFSKSMVLNVYSDYINNFTNSMALIKKACMTKPAFLEFLKKTQASSPDRVTLYGLMVKPIQRFPQFILLLQDMLKNTPDSHADRLPLQLALSELETLAEKLNEQKRVADQEAELQQLAHSVAGGKFHKVITQVSVLVGIKLYDSVMVWGFFSVIKYKQQSHSCVLYLQMLNSESRQLVHSEVLTETVYGDKGQVLKSKERKVFLLNDSLICTNIVRNRGPPDISSPIPVGPRYTVKWCVPLLETKVVEVGQDSLHDRDTEVRHYSATCSTSENTFLGSPKLYQELEELQHDLDVVERVCLMVGTLNGTYQNLNTTVSQDWCLALQRLIRLKEEEIQNANKSRLRLSIPGKPDRSGHPVSIKVVFNTTSSLSKIVWVNRLHLAKIAQRPENKPCWKSAEENEKKKVPFGFPLMTCRLAGFSSRTYRRKLNAALHSPSRSSLLGFCTVTTTLPQGYLWVAGGGATYSQLEIFSLNRVNPRLVKTITLKSPVLCMEYVKEPYPFTEEEPEKNHGLTKNGNIICAGLQDGSIKVYSSLDTSVECQQTLVNPDSSPVISLKHLHSLLFAGLFNGNVAVYQRKPGGLWDLEPHRLMSLGSAPVSSLLSLKNTVWASCANQVTVIHCSSLHIQCFNAHTDPSCSVSNMVGLGGGVWMGFTQSSSIHLFHRETLELLQEVNIYTHIVHPTSDQVYVSSLLICSGLLWVGTSEGDIITFPVSTLEGIPKIRGKGMMSLNAHCGPVDFLVSASSSLISDLNRLDSTLDGRKEAVNREEKDGGEVTGRVEGDGGELSLKKNVYSKESEDSPLKEQKPGQLLLQYSLLSTCQLPGKLLTAAAEQDFSTRAAPPVAQQHNQEDSSIYEVCEDPGVWVRGRSVKGGQEGEVRQNRVTSTAIFSGGRGYRRVGGTHSEPTNPDSIENTLMVWQLPLTLSQ